MSSLEAEFISAINLAGAAQNDLSKNTPTLQAALTNSTAKGLPEISINPSQGTQLSILCQMLQAKNVLEIGTLGGYSTIWFATSVPGIKVTSIEYNPKHRDVALENLKNAGVDNVEVILGAGLDVLPKLADRTFDFVFIDANWDQQREYFDWAVKLTRQGGAIYVDNVVRQLAEGEGDGSLAGRELIDFVKNDERVQATLIPTLSTQKKIMRHIVDGYLLATVK